MDYSEADYMEQCANMDRETSPLSHLRACVDAYKAVKWAKAIHKKAQDKVVSEPPSTE